MTDQTNNVNPTSPMQEALNYKWRFALSTIGAVAAVFYAAENQKKGKFWYYLGGSLVGGAIGYLIDSSSKN